MKMLALSFLILIGSLLVMEGWNPKAAHDLHLKNYIYFAMVFSFIARARIRHPEGLIDMYNLSVVENGTRTHGLFERHRELIEHLMRVKPFDNRYFEFWFIRHRK